MSEFRLTHHAREEMARRQIAEEIVVGIMGDPEQIVEERSGRKAYQSRIEMNGKQYLVRLIVEDQEEPNVVVTLYRTSNVAKYWRLS